MAQLLNYNDGQYKVLEPTAYHATMMADYAQDENVKARLKTKTMLGIFMIFVCLQNHDTGDELIDELDESPALAFEKFIKTLSLTEFSGLKEMAETFQDFSKPKRK